MIVTVSDSADLGEESGATATCVEQENEFALGITDRLRQTVECRQGYNDQTSTKISLRVTDMCIVLTAPQMHTYKPHIGVAAQSTLGGTKFLPEKYV